MLMQTRQVQKGFTLLEVMVVVAIIAIIAGLSVFSIAQAGDRRYQHDADKLAAWLQQLSDLALLENTAYGLAVEDNKVIALVNYDTLWVAASMPEPYEFSATAEIDFAQSTADLFPEQAEDEKTLLPELIMVPGGGLFPVAELYLSFPTFEDNFVFSWDRELGRINLQRQRS